MPIQRTAAARAALALGAIAASAGLAFAAPNSDSTAANPGTDNSSAIVVLNGEPLATYGKTRPPRGKKIDFAAHDTKSYRAQLSALRTQYKQWLQANYPQAKITGNFDISLNAVAVQLNGAPLAGISASSLVKSAQYEGLYYKTAVDHDLALIKATEAWTATGVGPNAGAGVKVAIVDSGVDAKHPCFDDTGYAPQTQVGDKRFTNNKVIAARVFNNKTPGRGYTAEAIDSHGTHVAGTVGCNYQTPASVEGVTIPAGVSGVAPKALLGNYNIFPADVAGARSEDILNALESAYEDGMDVANMSLGGSAHGIQDLLTNAVDNLDLAGMVVAVANGNEGPGYRTVSSPGSAARALSAGAGSVGHRLVSIVSVGGTDYTAIKGDFGSVPPGGLTAPLAVLLDAASPFGGVSTACDPIGADLTGQIAFLTRGVCEFTVKLRNVQAAGGVGALVVNREAGDPLVMGQNDDADQPTIPGFMVGLEARDVLKTQNGAATSFPALQTYVYDAARDDIIADFTSWGPTDVDFRVKPDVVSNGVNVVSSIPTRFCDGAPCFAFFNGTSMASPHLAGSAAFLRGVYTGWSAADIRSAIVNTAVTGVLKDNAGIPAADVNVSGAGREDLSRAAAAVVALDPVSVSFGAVPSGSGQTSTRIVTLRNLSDSTKTFAVAADSGGAGVSYGVSPASATLAPGATASLTVTAVASKGAAFGAHAAQFKVSVSGSEVAHAVLYTLIK